MTYNRIVIKLSGEALLGNKDNGEIISNTQLNYTVNEIKSALDLGIEILVVLGGGNIVRGVTSTLQLERYKTDNMGMLATIINSIALQEALTQINIPAVLLSAIEVKQICELYRADIANKYLSEKKVVICAGGISNPYFSTDTTAVLRALEVKAEVFIKATQVDGIYNKDPKQFTDAKRLNKVSYKEVLAQDLKVLDSTAVCLAETNKLPIIIFNIHQAGALKKLLTDECSISVIK